MEEGTSDGTQREHQRMGWLGTRVAGGDDIHRFTCGSYGWLDLIVEGEWAPGEKLGVFLLLFSKSAKTETMLELSERLL